MKETSDKNIHSLTDHLFREHYGKMVSYLSQKYGYQEIENILDAVQESFETALNTWKYSNVPSNHFAWLYKVANNKLINKIRHSNIAKSHLGMLKNDEYTTQEYNEKEAEDSSLKFLIFFSRIDFSERNKLIVSLYFLCGFGYAEIANSLILKIETVKKIILRSKETIKTFAENYNDSQIEFTGENRKYLLKIIYLLFNEGYKTSKKNSTINYDICYEAIRLGKLIQNYNLDDSETNSLLALMFFNSSRFPARMGEDTWISMEEQDRNLWNKTLISEGFFYLRKTKFHQYTLNKYYIEALISSIHCTSENYEKTDWKTIAYLYRQLEKIQPASISVKLNRIISESNFLKTEILISELSNLKKIVTEETAFCFFSSIAHLYFRLKEWNSAIENYKFSLNYTKNKTDIIYINKKISLIEKNIFPEL